MPEAFVACGALVALGNAVSGSETGEMGGQVHVTAHGTSSRSAAE
jgi:hypothetical protein